MNVAKKQKTATINAIRIVEILFCSSKYVFSKNKQLPHIVRIQ